MSLVPGKLDIREFIKLKTFLPVVDVRSPAEYLHGHVPGAVNIPLFDDQQRATVGTTYKKKGRMEAVLSGLDLTAPLMSYKLKEIVRQTREGDILFYCWRGGMRSESMAWLAALGGMKPQILGGGYKSYRQFILDDLGRKREYVLLGGLTGSGKTQILSYMASSGSQVADLEGMACHKGSAFGAMGQMPQPSSEHFANLLFEDLAGRDESKTIWLEDESRNIGSVFMPDAFYNTMQESPLIALMMSIETRLPRLIKEYTSFPKEAIVNSVMRISKRLGGDRTKVTLEAIEADDYASAIRIVLGYYDKAYMYGLSKRNKGDVIFIETDTDDVALNAAKVAEAAGKV